MLNSRTRPSLRRRTGLVAGIVLGSFGTAAVAIDCQLSCRQDSCEPVCATARCGLKSPDGEDVKVLDRTLKSLRDCELLKQGNGDLELRYRHKGRWFSPPGGVPKGGALAELFKQYPADPCGVPSRNCLQTRMNGMVAAVGGHGIDNKESKPGGQGDPCLMGLPCGAIVPPPAQWSFQLPDAARGGSLTVRLARGTPPAGQPAEQTLRVERGVVSGNGAWFVPGAQYAYRYADESGRAVASGEFSLVSRSTHDTLRTLTQRRVAEGMSESLAWSDTLAANQLEWDALQLSMNPGGAR